MRPRAATLLTLLALVASACATHRIDLSDPDAAALARSGPPTMGKVVVVRFHDARTREWATGRQVGQMREGYGIPVVAVEAEQDPVLWVADGLAHGLALHGYEVERLDAPPADPSAFVVMGSVVQVFGDAYLMKGAGIVADVWLVHGGWTIWSGRCEGTSTSLQWPSLEHPLRAALLDARKQLVARCVPPIATAIERAKEAQAAASS
ncbi:MAG TPA: hypothetical protein VIS07_08135 [Candidatus Binatia bacterium]